MTSYEAQALLSLMTHGRDYVHANFEGRIGAAGDRVTDALSEVARARTEPKSERARKRTWMDV